MVMADIIVSHYSEYSHSTLSCVLISWLINPDLCGSDAGSCGVPGVCWSSSNLSYLVTLLLIDSVLWLLHTDYELSWLSKRSDRDVWGWLSKQTWQLKSKVWMVGLVNLHLCTHCQIDMFTQYHTHHTCGRLDTTVCLYITYATLFKTWHCMKHWTFVM